MGQISSRLETDLLDLDESLSQEGYLLPVILLSRDASSIQWIHPYQKDFILQNPSVLNTKDYQIKLDRAIQLETYFLNNRGRNDMQVSVESNIRKGRETTYVGFQRK